jgi:hypothetical protein
MSLPEWVQKYKEPRTEIKYIQNCFYKYEVEYIYNKEKKRTDKKTVRMLGKITEKNGFIPSPKDTLRKKSEELPRVDIKTYGVYNLFTNLIKEEISSLTEMFGSNITEILLSFSMMRWAYQTPIKRSPNYHSHDFCSENWSTKSMSDKIISGTLKILGENREKVVAWMRTLLGSFENDEQSFVLMDSTHSFSTSENLVINAKGYNPDFDFQKQIRLMYIFSTQIQRPVYYRLINGNITDVKSMALCVNEMNVKATTVFIADKGFFSIKNIEMMNEENLAYIIPLQRNNDLIDLEPFKKITFKKTLSYFFFQKRIIWYHSYTKDAYQLITFLDEELRIEEERDYLSRIETHPDSYSKEKFDEKLHRFGTITIIHKIYPSKKKEAPKKQKRGKTIIFEQEIFEAYKQRNEIEVMFDSYKTCLKADVTYMQNRYVLEGWLFANFIAMIAYYKLYSRLNSALLLAKYSPKDIIEMSKAICKMKIRGEWHTGEITMKIIKIFEKIGIDYLN